MNEERRCDAAARRVLVAVLDERDHQRNRWSPEQDVLHSHFEWITVLSGWLGKAATCAIGGDAAGLRKRLVQVTAIGLAAIEAIDREPKPKG